MASSISYATRVAAGWIVYFWDQACPYCEGTNTRAVGRKHMILQLRACGDCGLKYRFPKDYELGSRIFYESNYNEPSVTNLPSEEELEGLVRNSFKGSPFDRTEKIDFALSSLGASAKDMSILDYGASFGHILSQLRARGLNRLLGYEIARPRASFGTRYLGEDIRSNLDEILKHPLHPFDAILTSHVLEHLPRLRVTFEFFRQALRVPGGKLFIWVPNASREALERFHQGSWAPLVGEPHPLAIDHDFLCKVLPQHGFRILETGPRDAEELRLVAEAV